jgi:hypothetical protein
MVKEYHYHIKAQNDQMAAKPHGHAKRLSVVA